MKSFITILALGVGITSGIAQGFFDLVPFKGAFNQNNASPTTIKLNGQTVKKSDGTDWVVNNGNWLQDWTNFDPQNTLYPGDANYSGPSATDHGTKSGDISGNVTWGNSDGTLSKLVISGAIHVLDGATLTIYPNTIIRGDQSNISFLLVAKGGKIFVKGTPDKPVVFTSNKAPGSRAAGDWAGFLIMGKSQNNTSSNGTGIRRFEALPSDPLSEYGGGANYDVNDFSGEVQFLRIEFAGYNYLPDQEINGVTFGAVGARTKFDFCEVSYSRDDSFEWFGGTNNHKYLVAYAGIDDEFDMDEGYQGHLQFLLGVRRPEVFETSAGGSSHGFEHDNNTGLGTTSQNVAGLTNPQPATRPIISNASIVGPRIGTLANITGNRFNAGMAFRTGDETNVYNSIVIGYPRQFQLFHPDATILPSVHNKILGDGFANTPSGYVPNEVKNTVLIKDVADSRSGLGSNTGTVQSQSVPANATYGSDGLFQNGGTLLNDAGFTSYFNTTGFGNTINTSIGAASVFTQPFVTTPTTLNFTLVDATYANADFSHSNLSSNTVSSIPVASLFVNPTSLPQIFTGAGKLSSAYVLNVYASNLTGSGISVVGNSSFLVSLTNTTSPSAWATSQNLPVSGGVAYISFLSTTVGNQSGNIIVTSIGDSRVNGIIVPVSGSILQNAVPYVTTSDAQLPSFIPNDIKTFTVSGNLLTSPAVITGSDIFQVSLDGATFGTTATLNPSFKLLAPTVVYVRYIPTSTAAGGVDEGSVVVTSTGGNSEIVNLSGEFGTNILVGPLDANGQIQQISIVPSFPTLNSFTGLPSPSVFTYIGASNIPAGGLIQVSASTAFQLSYDNVTFTSGVLTFAGVGGSLSPTKIYVRYQGSGSTIGAPVVKIGLQGNSAFDKLIGLQGVSAIAISAVPKTGTISTSFSNTVVGVGTSFTTYNLGAPLYSPNSVAGSFLGLVSEIIDDYTIVLDRIPTNQSLTGTTFFSSSSAMVNVSSDQWESNKDFNRGALLFPYTTLSSSSTANPTAPLSFTVTGYNTNSFTVARDLTTYYSLYVELSFDGGNTWVASKTITSAGIATQVVLVRYNPTGLTANGTINGVAYGPNLGQHTGAINAGGVTVYTIGYSDPILNVSSSPIPSKDANANNTFATLADLNTLADRPSFPVPIYVAGHRLQGDVTVSSPNSNIEFSLTPAFTNPQSSITLPAPSFTVDGVVFARYNPNGQVFSGAALVNVSTVKVSSPLSVNLYSAPVPTPFISLSSNVFTLTVGGTAIVTVSGDNLTQPITITTPSGFSVSTSTISITSTNFGSANGTLTFTFTGTSTASGAIGLSSGLATPQYITLAGVLGIEDDLINGITSVRLYPNPTSGDATLDLSIAKGSNVTIMIHNITGTEISRIAAGGVSPGIYSYVLSNLNSGLYFITVITDSYKRTEKLIVY